MYLRASLGLSIDLTARLNWIGWFTVPAAMQILYYSQGRARPGGEDDRLHPLSGLARHSRLCLFTNLIVTPGYSVIPFINHPGPLENPARLFGSLLAIWLFYDTAVLKKQLSGIKKAQLNYFFQGVLIFGGGAAITAGFLQVLGGFGFEPGLASFFSLPWVALTYYAMTRHRLFDTQLVFIRVLSVVILLGIFSIMQIWMFKFLEPALGESFAILISLSVIGIIFFVTRISRKIQQQLQQLIVQDKFDYQGVLKESIKAIITILAARRTARLYRRQHEEKPGRGERISCPERKGRPLCAATGAELRRLRATKCGGICSCRDSWRPDMRSCGKSWSERIRPRPVPCAR